MFSDLNPMKCGCTIYVQLVLLQMIFDLSYTYKLLTLNYLYLFTFAPMLKWNLQLAGQAGPEPGREIKSMIGNEVCELSHNLYRLIKSCLCAYPEMWRPFVAQANVWGCRPLNFEEILGCLALAAPWWASGCWWYAFRRKLQHGEEDDI